MTQVRQHQQPMKNAIERAENAITFAQEARFALEQAQVVAEPLGIQTAHSRLLQAEREVADAMSQLEAHHTESQHQSLIQTLTNLRQAAQDIDIATEAYQTPRQMR